MLYNSELLKTDRCQFSSVHDKKTNTLTRLQTGPKRRNRRSIFCYIYNTPHGDPVYSSFEAGIAIPFVFLSLGYEPRRFYTFRPRQRTGIVGRSDFFYSTEQERLRFLRD
jgi:hypothetical protein